MTATKTNHEGQRATDLWKNFKTSVRHLQLVGVRFYTGER